MNWQNLSAGDPHHHLARYVRRHARPICVTAGALAAGAAVYHHVREKGTPIRLRLTNPVIEAVSGAVGEVAQIVCLYPLDTIKVRCQAAGIGTGAAVADIARRSSGSLLLALQILYAGALPAAATSILVGAVHYVCFCTTKRAVQDLPMFSSGGSSSSSSQGALGGAGAAGADGSSSGSSRSRDQEEAEEHHHQQQHHHHHHLVHSHGATGSHYLPISSLPEDSQELAAEDLQPAAAAAAAGQQPSNGAVPDPAAAEQQQLQAAASSSSSPSAAAAAGADGQPAAGRGQHDRDGSPAAANVLAAVLTAAATAVVEAPLELFRHNSQAGQFQGNFVAEMYKVMRQQGPGALYWGFVPYCLESWPYDVTELLVVGGLKDARDGSAGPRQGSTQLGAALAAMPAHMYDLAVGAVAGTAAVLVSMPFDCIKTYMQTHGQEMAGAGVLGSAGAFWQTGADMVARRGPGALYVGLVPRLMHQVPGAMVCWWAIEGCHRYLQQFKESSSSRQGLPLAVPAAAAAAGGAS